MQQNLGDRAPLNASAGATVGVLGSLTEKMLARGTFDMQCLAVKPGCEAQFLPLWRRRTLLERKRDRMFVRMIPGAVKSIVEEMEDLLQRMRRFQEIQWALQFPNTVATVGKNLALDTFLAGSSYTVTGPYMGLISSASYSATAAGDTMGSHAGWLEAGNANAPTYSGNRKTCGWSSASAGAKALSSALSFSITGTGTVKGAFIVFGSGASNSVDNTSGTLMSAGVFSGGDQAVVNTNVLQVSYSLAF